jgi:citrate lyase subunit beta/citryl-CoA lyase
VTIRPRRSALYLPASNLKAIEKARRLPCDVVILDLEDAVAPDVKETARQQAIEAVQHGGFGSRELVVRINALDTQWGMADLQALANSRAEAILIPKVSSAADVLGCAQHLGGSGAPALWAMIETAMAILRLQEIAAVSSSARLACFVMGTNDLAKELRANPDAQRSQFASVLMQSVIAARAYGLSILDGVYNGIDDLPGLETQCRQAHAFGFDGKTLIHPTQIDICNAVFTPDAATLAWAQQIVAAFEQPENQNRGAIKLGGKMVERLHLAEAQRMLLLAQAAGIVAAV